MNSETIDFIRVARPGDTLRLDQEMIDALRRGLQAGSAPIQAKTDDEIRVAGALAFIDLLLTDDVFSGDRDSRPTSPRDLAGAWRDAGYRQAVLDVYESILCIVETRGLSERTLSDQPEVTP